ncbi:hypothetical protein [Ferrimonas sediminum]|uniref:hypothetical protein n=1 Tax=Ferrimonas sediminum TaxID=718193 RepID=UPI001FDEDBE1|nr:hypothetical protein [Ferrimonas sediminum]
MLAFASALFFYAEALKNGLAPKTWAVAGLLCGPLVWPLFQVHRRMAMLQCRGQGNVIWKI